VIIPGSRSDYEHLSRFHYCGQSCGPIRQIYKLIDDHRWRGLAAPVVGIIVYGAPSANLAARNRAAGGVFAGLDRSAALTLLNERLLCIRRVIIEPRYRGLGLAARLVRETLPLTGAAMVEAVSTMGRMHPFFQRAGMTAFETPPDAKTERMQAALEMAGLNRALMDDSTSVHTMIEQLQPDMRRFVQDEMARFCQKFTNRRREPHSLQRTDFILSKLTHQPAYYLWTRRPEIF
jgi:GNAT superfamily N-acetyltransferase